MRKRFLLSLLVALLTSLSTHAYNFKSGGLYYNTTSNNTVEVTYQKYQSASNYQGLTTATIPETVTYNGTTYSVTSIGNEAFKNCSSLTSITIPNSVTSIGGYAFCYCSSLTSITIGNSVTRIGNYAFSLCFSLTSITIPNSVTSIGDGAFSNCSFLTSITIPNSVTSIGNSAFECCNSLTSITIGNSVTSIGNEAFENCSSLTSITIPNSVTSIGGSAFRECSSLTSITLPNSVTSIGENAFDRCSSLTSITIPNSVTSIGRYAFWQCNSLTSITIGNSVTSIGDNAFGGCTALTSITCLATTPPACGSYCFNAVPRTIPLYVPAESIEAYKAADTWKEFQVQALPPSYSPVDLVSITVDDEEIADFDPKVLTYDIALPEGTTTIPTIDATAYNEEAQVLLIQATTLPGQASAVVITTDSTQTYTIYFSKKSTPTDISDRPDTTGTDSNNGAEKLLRNGQVLIIRNDKTYNMMGQRL